MNKTKIEWTDYSWNPITGCLHGCWYCYAYKMFQRFHRSFEPTFHPERLDQLGKVKKPSKIFACSVADPFAKWTPQSWVMEMLNAMERHKHHIYQMLTKQPQDINPDYDLHRHWVGVTVNDQSETWKLDHILKLNAKVRFASFEPLLGEITSDLSDFEWIIVGKLTGSKKVPLKREWVEKIIKEARSHDIPIFIKNNVNWPENIQQFPEGYNERKTK